MATTIDARGLSCPQPVLMTMDMIKSATGQEIVVLVDTDTARENVSRAAASLGWNVTAVDPDGTEYRLTIKKG